MIEIHMFQTFYKELEIPTVLSLKKTCSAAIHSAGSCTETTGLDTTIV